MGYYITTWEEVEDYADKLPSFEDEWEDFVYNVERFAKHDFEGLYNSNKYYEDINFEDDIGSYIASLESIKNKCDEFIKRLQKTIDDYKEHRRWG